MRDSQYFKKDWSLALIAEKNRLIVVPPAGFEPAHPPPEGGALSPELRGRVAFG